MSKSVTIKMDVRCAAAVRQVLFDSQVGYTYNEETAPSRIVDIRNVILQLDERISKIVGE
jgi:7-cyano-7-deazaguanine synthase in queuosine biosynthesis